jgi:cytochrome c-type biogenesis protein
VDGTTLLWLSFLAGLYAPIGSPCALVLYPGYLSFLAGMKGKEYRWTSPLTLGIAVAFGVIISLLLGGLLFALVLGALGAGAHALVSAATSLLLLVLALALILDVSAHPTIGRFPLPRAGTPNGAAFLLGLLFGIIILPCNAAVILFLLTLATSVSSGAEAMGLFLAFGIGMTLPLVLLAGISRYRGRQVMEVLSRYRLTVQRIAGLVMLIIAAWYLTVFLFPQFFR